MLAASLFWDGMEVLFNLDAHPIPWKTKNYQPSKLKTHVSKPAPPHPRLGDCLGFTKHHQISNNDVMFSENVS